MLLITRHHSFVWLIISEPLFACYYCIRKLGKGLLRWKCSLCDALPMGRKHSRICQTKDCNPRASDPAQHCLSPQTATVLCHSLCLENKLAVSPGVCVQRTRMWRAFLRSNSSDLTTIIFLLPEKYLMKFVTVKLYAIQSHRLLQNRVFIFYPEID